MKASILVISPASRMFIEAQVQQRQMPLCSFSSSMKTSMMDAGPLKAATSTSLSTIPRGSWSTLRQAAKASRCHSWSFIKAANLLPDFILGIISAVMTCP